jgi:hypothetical protein
MSSFANISTNSNRVALSYHPELTPHFHRYPQPAGGEVEILHTRANEAKFKEFVGLLVTKPYYARHGFNLKVTL